MSVDKFRLKLIWFAATFGGLGVGAAVVWFARSQGGLDADWWIAGLLGLALGVYARFLLIFALTPLLAPALRGYLVRTDTAPGDESVEVTTTWRSSGDLEVDAYIESYARSVEQITKTLVWILVIATVVAIMYVASLFGLVDFSW